MRNEQGRVEMVA